jgi:hypothetical protein
MTTNSVTATVTHLDSRRPKPSISGLALTFKRQTILPPASMPTSQVTPVHTLDINGRCIFCQEQPSVFYETTWAEYQAKHRNDPPLSYAKWLYYRQSCLDWEGWHSPHPAEWRKINDLPRVF